METPVGRELRVERCDEHATLACEDGDAVVLGEHLDVGAVALHDGSPDEHGVERLVEPRHDEIGLEAST